MNNLTLPPASNWFESQIMACAPDNTVLYGARCDLVIINYQDGDSPLDVKLIPRAHSNRIISVNINYQWNETNKLAITSSEDTYIKIWDVETLTEKKCLKISTDSKDRIVGAQFLNENRALGVTQNGLITVWVLSTNDKIQFTNLLGPKVTVTTFASCPHASYKTAFGLKNGLIVVADLRKSGRILYRLRGHERDIVSLSWCPAPINVFPVNPNNYVKGNELKSSEENVNIDKSEEIESNKANCIAKAELENTKFEDLVENITKQLHDHNINKTENIAKVEAAINDHANSETTDNALEITEDNTVKVDKEQALENVTSECKVTANTSNIKKNRPNPWVNLKHADDDEFPQEDMQNRELTVQEPELDFQGECAALLEKINRFNMEYYDNEEKPDEIAQVKVTPNSNNSSAQKEMDANDIFNAADRNKESTVEVKTSEFEKHECILKAQDDIPVFQDKLLNEINQFDAEYDNTIEQINVLLEKTALSNNGVTNSNQIHADKKTTPIEQSKDFEEPRIEENKESISQPRNIINDANEAVTSAGDATEEINVRKPECVEEEVRTEHLLASSARESKVYIWCGIDGRLQNFFTLPEVKTWKRGRNAKDLPWTVVNWVSPTSLLCTTSRGEVLDYVLPKPKGSSAKTYNVVHNYHKSLVFSLATPRVILTKDNWMLEEKLNVWSTGHDRYLLNTSLESHHENLFSFPLLNGYVTQIAVSSLDPNRITFGTTTGLIKIWNLSNPHVRKVSLVNVTQKIQSKITYLAWHPVMENLLAFGTYEGTVAISDASNPNKNPSYCKHYFNSTVYKIEWGPTNGNSDKLGLYAISEGKILIYPSNKMTDECQLMELPDNCHVYTFAWKPDFQILLVIDITGLIYIYSSQLNILSKFYHSKKKLQYITWHPDAAETSLEQSYWFAAAIDESIVVYDFKNVEQGGEYKIEDCVVAVLDGHVGSINAINWSLFNRFKLISAGEDGTIQVWNVKSKTLESTYCDSNAISTAIWSPVSEDFVISATKNNDIKIWNVNDYPPPDNVEEFISKKKQSNRSKPKQDSKEVCIKQEEKKSIKKSPKFMILPSFGIKDGTPLSYLDEMQHILRWKENVEKTGDSDTKPEITQLFGNQVDMFKLLKFKEKECEQKGQYKNLMSISLWKGDFVNTIKQAVEAKKVTPLIVSLAPMVSPRMWQEACETYASQLMEETDSDPMEIATYYLACHKINEAINVLCTNGFFREALALAKCRLPEENPLINEIIEKWAKASILTGNFEVAAECYMVLDKYEEAVKALFKRSDQPLLEFALSLAKKTNNQELINAVAFRCKSFEDQSDLSNVDIKTELQDKNSTSDQSNFSNIDIKAELKDEKFNKICDKSCSASEDQSSLSNVENKAEPLDEKFNKISVLDELQDEKNVDAKKEVTEDVEDNQEDVKSEDNCQLRECTISSYHTANIECDTNIFDTEESEEVYDENSRCTI